MVLPKANPAGSLAGGQALVPAVAGRDWLALAPPNAFICPYCSRPFPSPHAFGGHQNAHRKERLEERRLFAKARNAIRSRAAISPRPLRIIIPSSVLENDPQYDPDQATRGGRIRNHKGKNAMKLLEGRKQSCPGGQAPRKHPRRDAMPMVLESPSSSTGSNFNAFEDLDLELKL